METPRHFFDQIDGSKLRLSRPRKFILLCGGAFAPLPAPPPSAREEFLRSLKSRNSFDDYDIRLAEDIDAFYPDSPYKNLIELEIDIAQISDCVFLFSEGSGSLAELGAFSQRSEIAKRMLVVLQSLHYDNVKSFVRDGPIRYLEDAHESSVIVFDWHTIILNGKFELDLPSFRRHLDDIKSALRDRLNKIPRAEEYDAANFAHKVIFATGIVDAFGAATFEDFKVAFEKINTITSDAEIRRMLFIAVTAKWITLEQRGHQKFYLPNFDGEPCEFAYKATATQRELVRWKRDIRAYWAKNDRQRSFLIIDHPRSGGIK